METATQLNKVVRIGTINIAGRNVSVFCRIEYRNGRLSISGVEGPQANGNCVGCCGQIARSAKDMRFSSYAEGWNKELKDKFFKAWDRWHLNDMRAGSREQEDFLRANPLKVVYPQTYYDEASKVLKEAGLNPDKDGYLYGHEWKREEVPSEIIEFLASLPETDKIPAWV